MENREQHLAWCKQRALEYCKAGNPTDAWASFASDMSKHPETSNHPALKIGMMMLVVGMNKSVSEMTKFIEGFN